MEGWREIRSRLLVQFETKRQLRHVPALMGRCRFDASGHSAKHHLSRKSVQAPCHTFRQRASSIAIGQRKDTCSTQHQNCSPEDWRPRDRHPQTVNLPTYRPIISISPSVSSWSLCRGLSDEMRTVTISSPGREMTSKRFTITPPNWSAST